VPLAPPLLLMLLWRSGEVAGGTGDWFNWSAKAQWVTMILRDRWMWFDLASVALLCLLVAGAIRTRWLRFSRQLAAAALALAAAYLLLPRILLGSAYADMRLAPYLLALALISVRLVEAPARAGRLLAVAGLVFFTARTAAATVSTGLHDARYDRELAAVNALPQGARVVAFVGKTCADPWAKSRLDHLPALAIVRREAFANDQWALAGAQLLRVTYPAGGAFVADPSQLVVPRGCRAPEWRTIDAALRDFPRGAFDYVWLIGPPPHDTALLRDLRPVWRSGESVLYRIMPAQRGNAS
jgi:hypothetical protein